MTTIHPVHLVGAGPGDPDLLTVKALRLIEEADVVVYDRLVSDGIMALVPEGTTKIFAGKASRKHHMPQEDINSLLVKLAKAGHRVVRLKGGDPLIFGRGSEEAQELARDGVPFAIVPGITASSACTAYAGIPLTHRGLSRSVTLVTGHCQEGSPLELKWDKLANPDGTLVIYMGLTNVDQISGELIKAGLPADTPAAAIQNGSLPNQRNLHTTLSGLPEAVREADMKAPTLMVIGQVAALASELAWRDEVAGEDDSEAHA